MTIQTEQEIGKANVPAASELGARRRGRLLAAVSPRTPADATTPEARRDFAERVGDLMAERQQVSLQYPANSRSWRR